MSFGTNGSCYYSAIILCKFPARYNFSENADHSISDSENDREIKGD